MDEVKEGQLSREKKILLWLCYVSFGLIGYILSMRTNIFQYVQKAYLDGYEHIAMLVLVSGLLMQVALYFSGFLIERIGYQKSLLIGMAVFTVPVFLFLPVRSVLSFDLVFIFLMVGYGIAMLVLNLFVSHLVPERKGNVLLILHLFFAIGALIGPKWISGFVDAGAGWQAGTALMSIPLAVTVFIIFRINRRIALPSAEKRVAPGEKRGLKRLFSPFVGLFIVIYLTSQTWEFGMGTWFVIYANDTRGMNPSQAAWYLTLFYGSYPLVRIVFSKVVHKLNLLVLLVFAFSLCAGFVGLAVWTGNLLFFSLTGLGVALLYPAILAAMQDHFGEGETTIIGFISMAGGLIQYVAIWSVGIISNRFGIAVGFPSLVWYLVAGGISVLAILLLQVKSRNTVIRESV